MSQEIRKMESEMTRAKKMSVRMKIAFGGKYFTIHLAMQFIKRFMISINILKKRKNGVFTMKIVDF